MKKLATEINEQINKLKSYNLKFDDEEKAKEILLDIGYYRLGFYIFPFEKSYPNLYERDHSLVEGVHFKDIHDLYVFDTELRQILFFIIERIEVNIRTQIIYTVSNYYKNSPVWFIDNNVMENSFTKDFYNNVYKNILSEPIIRRHHKKYINDKYAPAWKTLEFMNLGSILKLYEAIKNDEVKTLIAQKYSCSIKVFLNYFEVIRILRNKCAHGDRIFDINIPKGIKKGVLPLEKDDRHNINGVIKVIEFMLKSISHNRAKDFIYKLNSLKENYKSSNIKPLLDKFICVK